MSTDNSEENVPRSLNSDVLSDHENDTEVFYFESDHLALKGNSDYCNLLKTISLLEAQRIKLLKDIENLHCFKEKVRDNPELYLSKVANGDFSDVPTHTKIEEVPKIDWSKYDLISARLKRKAQFSDLRNIKKEDDEKIRVRGRVYNESKPQTFNQLWTTEEQLRLEELLVEFPPERTEYNRYRKIANALGNRTAKQVCSRVQKYFLKLQKVGIKGPGQQNLFKKNVKNVKSKKQFYKNTTFFPTLELGETLMSDSEEEDNKADEDDTFEDQLKIDILVKVKERKIKDESEDPYVHEGISCTLCGEKPLEGTRWHCLECKNVDLCSDCVIGQVDVEVPEHPVSHKLHPMGNPEGSLWDPEYVTSNNYLDPNYLRD